MPLTKDTFAGKVALITGSNSGIGEGTAKALAQAGCAISLHGRNVDKLNRVAADLRELGLKDEQVLTTSADLADDDQLKQLCKRTIDHFGRLDILVNNAGIATVSELQSFDEIHRIMLRAQVMMCLECEEALKATKGCIINVSSVYARVAEVPAISYCVAKAGLDHFTRNFAQQMAPFGVRVNTVNPGFVYTSIFEELRQREMPTLAPEMMQEIVRNRIKEHPLGRLGEKEDIGNAIAFLASDMARWITGVCMPVDGGYLIAPKLSESENTTFADSVEQGSS